MPSDTHLVNNHSQRSSNTVQAVWILIGSMSSFLFTLATSAVLSRYLDKADYGTYRQVIFLYQILLVVFSAGMPKVLSFYLPRFPIEQGKAIANRVLLLLLFAGLAFSFVLYNAADYLAALMSNNELSSSIRMFSLVPAFLLPTMVLEGIFASYKNTYYLAVYNFLSRAIIFFCVIAPIVVFDMDYSVALLGWVFGSLFSLVIALKMKDIPFRRISCVSCKIHYLELIKYGFPIMLSSVVGVLIGAADLFFVSRFFGAEAVAVYANGFVQIPFVIMITGAASAVLLPIFSDMSSSGKSVEIAPIWRSAVTKSAVVIYPMVAFFILNAHEIIVVLFTDAYVDSVKYFRIAMVQNYFNVVVFAPVILAFGRLKTYTLIHLFLACSIWTIDYFVVHFFNSPISIALVSAGFGVLKTCILAVYTVGLLNITVGQAVPLGHFLCIMLHSLFVVSLAYFVSSTFVEIYGPLAVLLCSLFIAVLFLIISSKWLGLDYLSSVAPILRRVREATPR